MGLSCKFGNFYRSFKNKMALNSSNFRNKWTCFKSLSRKIQEKERKRERLACSLIFMRNRALLPFSKMTGLLSTVSSKLESAIVKKTSQSLALLYYCPF